jgi:hypothetical protein
MSRAFDLRKLPEVSLTRLLSLHSKRSSLRLISHISKAASSPATPALALILYPQLVADSQLRALPNLRDH